MNTDEHRFETSNRRFALHLCLSVFIGGSFLFVSTVNSAQTTREGLDALGDDALMNELASRGLDSLLERAFEVNKVPEGERQGRRTLLALARLTDPNARLSAVQRQRLVAEIVAGIEKALPAISDPNLLMRQAFVLITQGAERDVNTLEYWGENPRTQASLGPVVQTVIKVLDRCIERAKAQADALANQITSPTSPIIARYEEMERLAATAEYTRSMVQYYLALSIDPAGNRRKEIANEASEYLRQFDVPENPDRGIVRNRLAKLAMVKGDFDAARKLFADVINDSAEPKPTIAQQYEARYFTAVCEVLARNVAAATKELEALQAWQSANLPSDKAARDGAEAAAFMLKYRIASLEADLTRDPAAKAQANDKAVSVLMDLLSKRPDLRGIIYEQLLPKLDENTDLKSVDVLVLRALVSRGEQEIQRPRTETPDTRTLQRAIDAAREVVRRRGQSDVDGQMVDAAALLVPFFLERLGSKPEAAYNFVEYANQFKTSNPRNATLALDNAQALIGELRGNPATRDDLTVVGAYEAFLRLAVAEPFNRKEFAFEYARRLQLNGDPKKAIEYYALVPADDKRLLEARFLELVALKQLIDEGPANTPDRNAVLTQIQKLADEVNREATRRGEKSMLVRTLLLAADLARREQKNPQRALELLSGFENSVTGLPNSDQLINEAMYIRVQSHMAADQYTQATQELVKLLNKTEGGQGAQIVYNLLEKLNADFDRAQEAGDRPAMKALSRSRAQLSGFLVDWAANNADPNIKKFTYRYRVFDADTQRRAAELEDDPAARQAGMKLALARYEALQAPENLALYKASADPQVAADPDAFDPQVLLGIALIHYELGQFEPAAAAFSQLITTRQLGQAVYTVEDNGQQKVVDNDQYWEAILKLIRCNQKLGTGIEESKSYLKLQYITWGQRVGGRKWKAQYEALRRELIPDFQIEAPAGQS
jgi:hypothetical protein